MSNSAGIFNLGSDYRRVDLELPLQLRGSGKQMVPRLRLEPGRNAWAIYGKTAQ
jgi:hypothetical protein